MDKAILDISLKFNVCHCLYVAGLILQRDELRSTKILQ